MPEAHEGLRYLAAFEIFHNASIPNDVLELTTDNDKFRCLVTREMFLRLSAAFARHVEIVDAEGSQP
jgi:hypothetical protein